METRDVSFYSLMRPNTLSPSGKRRMGKDEASFQKWMITVPHPGSWNETQIPQVSSKSSTKKYPQPLLETERGW
jgi:hypothetical protein